MVISTQNITCPKRSVACGFLKCSAKPVGPGATLFFLRPEKSHTLTDWSNEADTNKSSVGWNCAHMT